MNRCYRSRILSVIAVTLLGVTVSQAAEESKATAAFEQLASLVGEWKGVHGRGADRDLMTALCPLREIRERNEKSGFDHVDSASAQLSVGK